MSGSQKAVLGLFFVSAGLFCGVAVALLTARFLIYRSDNYLLPTSPQVLAASAVSAPPNHPTDRLRYIPSLPKIFPAATVSAKPKSPIK